VVRDGPGEFVREDRFVRRFGRPIVFAIVVGLGAWAARAQNLDEGKTAPQLFEADCSACHKGPQGLGKNASVGFLRQHYTSSAQSASLLAAYLAAAGNNPRAERKRVGTGEEKAGTGEEKETKSNRKTREKTAVARPPEEKHKTAAERRKERNAKRLGLRTPAASPPPATPASPPPVTATAPPLPPPGAAPGEGQTATAPPPAAPSGDTAPVPPTTATAAPAPSEAPVAAANPPPAGTPNPSPSRVADQPVFSTPLP
jgi:hypothetical protein